MINRVSKALLARRGAGSHGPWQQTLGRWRRHRGWAEGRGAALEVQGSSLGWYPWRASRPAEQPLRVLGSDFCPPLRTQIYKSWAPTPLSAGGSGFRIWFPHRSIVWWVGSQPGPQRPTSLSDRAVALWGPGPSLHHNSRPFPLPSKLP